MKRILLLAWMVLTLFVSSAWMENLRAATIQCQLISALNDGENFTDPKLSHVEKDLRKLFKFSSYRVVDATSLDLQPGESKRVKLGPNIEINVMEINVLKKVHHLRVELYGKGNKIFQSDIKVSNGNSVIVGSNYSGENAWIVALKVE